MIIPVWWVMAAIVVLAAMAWLAMNPDKLFYLLIFTIPFTERARVLPISFSLNELIIFYCAFVCFLHMVLRHKWVSLRTSLDGWIVLLVGMFFLAGFFSESDTGMLGFFKIAESFLVYYMAVYLVRARLITRSWGIKLVVITAISQALLGILQSFTGSFGADFESNRGYLGYLGLGSSHVWHGRGTTWHFNALGNFLATIMVFLIPMYIYIVKDRKKWALILGGIIFAGIITTYSRGSLLGIAAGMTFFLAAIQPSLKRALLFVGAFVAIFILPSVLVLGNTTYVETVSFNDRLLIWQVPLAAITSSDKALWFGSGLNSYSVVAWPYMPAWVPPDQFRNWFAHNYYLLATLEMGLVGAAIFFGFLGYTWFNAWQKFKSGHGLTRVYSLSLSAALITVFFVNIFDHSLSTPYFKVFIFLLLGLLYVKRAPVRKEPVWQY